MQRVRYLDILRGVAILGILPANIALFALPTSFAAIPAPVTGGAWHEVASWAVVRVLFDYKFITIFSMLFGAGLAIVHQRCRETGRPWLLTMVRRLLALGLFGLLHATLLWYGDIVVYYAFFGLLLFTLAIAPVRIQAGLGAALVAVPVLGLVVLLPPVAWIDTQPGIGAAVHQALRSSGSGFVPGSTQGSWSELFIALVHWGPELETEVYQQGTVARIAVLRLVTWVASAFGILPYFGCRIAGLFLLGMAAVRGGWLLRPEAHRGAFRRLALYGAVVALPLHAVVVIATLAAGQRMLPLLISELALYVGSVGLSAVYVGLLALLVTRPGGPSAWLQPFERIGRTAFSNYLLQSAVCTTLFYAYGLGLYGTLDRTRLWGVVLGVWGLQLAVTWLWCSRFRQGPVEWAWRSLAYLGTTRPESREVPAVAR